MRERTSRLRGYGEREALRPFDPPALGPFKLHRRLGEGAYGVVYEGERSDGVRAAVKLLRGRVTGVDRRRYEREVTALQSVTSEHVVRYVDHGEASEGLWLATELLEDAHSLDREGYRDRGLRDLDLIRQMLVALRELHSAEITHRDLHPGNVLVTKADVVKIVDLGLSLHGADRITTTNENIGHLLYTPPEQRGRQLPDWDPAADVYAWAATAVFTMQGRAPLTREQLFLGPLPPEDYDLRGVETSLEPVLRACLAPESANRPSTDHVLRVLRTTRTEWLQRDEADAATTRVQDVHWSVGLEGDISQALMVEPTYLHKVVQYTSVRSDDGMPAYYDAGPGDSVVLRARSVEVHAPPLLIKQCPVCFGQVAMDGVARCDAPLNCRDRVYARIGIFCKGNEPFSDQRALMGLALHAVERGEMSNEGSIFDLQLPDERGGDRLRRDLQQLKDETEPEKLARIIGANSSAAGRLLSHAGDLGRLLRAGDESIREWSAATQDELDAEYREAKSRSPRWHQFLSHGFVSQAPHLLGAWRRPVFDQWRQAGFLQ